MECALETLEGVVAIVTGGGRGLGRAYAIALAEAGASVAVVARTASELQETVAHIETSGGHAAAFSADVTDTTAVQSVVAQVESTLGPIQVLVNSAGVSDPEGDFWEIDPDVWWRTVEVNLRGVAICTRYVLSGMLQRRAGRIINIATDIGARAVTQNLGYACSKAAILNFTDSIAAATRDHGVAVFAISPGLVRTALTEDAWQAAQTGVWREGQLRYGLTPASWSPPELSADLVRLLASGHADRLSGRYIHARRDNLDELLQRIAEIEAKDLYALRIHKLEARPVE